MSQTTQSSRPGGQGGRPGGQGGRPRRPRREPIVIPWIPKTNLGKKVESGEITDMEEIYEKGYRIQEAGIIKKLLRKNIYTDLLKLLFIVGDDD